MVMDGWLFADTTFNLLHKVFIAEVYTDYIFITQDQVRRWDVNIFHYHFTKFVSISAKLGVDVWLEHPGKNGDHYKLCARLHMKPCSCKENRFCWNENIRKEVTEEECFACPYRIRTPIENMDLYNARMDF